MAELTVTGLPHLQAQWPGTSTGGKDTPASLQLGKRGEVLQALGAAAWQEKVGLRLQCQAQGLSTSFPGEWAISSLIGCWCQPPACASFSEASEAWRFSSDSSLVQGFGDFMWKYSIRMMGFLLQLYIQD